ncbi:ABC transporter substrate-binding protein [Oscillospiraceae bacterium HV4-5-C5C]|nr:ABC transporter substrate-binding protein [Oscillospiraceae bacterium HV4-5-C5C]
MKRHLSTTLKTALAIGLVSSLTSACAASTPATDSDTAAQTQAAVSLATTATTAPASLDEEENTIRFATQDGQIRTAINILADQLGYYQEEGVNVEFVNASATEALTAITTGKSDVDVLGTGIVPDLTFIANGADLVVFEGTAAEGGAIIACQNETETYKDLTQYAGITAAMQGLRYHQINRFRHERF